MIALLMSRRQILRTALLTAALVIMACSNDPQSNKGGVWDETGNTFAIHVSDSAGTPRIGARIHLVPQRDWSQAVLMRRSPVADSAFTDSAGQVRLRGTSWPVRIEVQDPGGVATALVYQSDTVVRLVLQRPGLVRGSMAGERSPWPTRILVSGTSYTAELSPSGAFTLEGIPQGVFVLGQELQSTLGLLTSVEVHPDSASVVDSLQSDRGPSVMLEDFEDPWHGNRYHPLTGVGWWFCGADGSSRTLPDNVIDAMVDAQDAPALGKVAHFQFEVDSTLPGHYALCGFDLGASRLDNLLQSQHDLAELDSITLWVKGNGRVRLQAISQLRLHQDSLTHLEAHLDLGPEWSRRTLLPQDFLPDAQGRTWAEVAHGITSFIFMENRTVEFWVDQIQLHGPSPQELFPQLRITP